MKVSIGILDSIIHSDLAIKAILLGLLVLSVISWAVLFERTSLFRATKKQMRLFEKKFWSGVMLEEFYKQIEGKARSPLARIFCAGMEEWSISNIAESSGAIEFIKKGIIERVSNTTNVALAEEEESLSKHQDLLSTIVSTAPFIGLFGTVWGVMNTFKAIAGSNTVTLNTIAPGIGEALVTTAIGILISVLTIFISDFVQNSKNETTSKMENFRLELISVLSRELDQISVMNYNKFYNSKKQQ